MEAEIFLFKNATRMPSKPPILTTCFDVAFALQTSYLQVIFFSDSGATKLLSRSYCFVTKSVVGSQENRKRNCHWIHLSI
jgi:hypothetical protein